MFEKDALNPCSGHTVNSEVARHLRNKEPSGLWSDFLKNKFYGQEMSSSGFVELHRESSCLNQATILSHHLEIKLERSLDPPYYLPWTLPRSICHRGFCPSGRKFYPPFFEACFRPPLVASDPVQNYFHSIRKLCASWNKI